MHIDLLLLKLVLTPLFVGAASLAARRWGAVIGGLLVGLPLTSGPVAFYLALDHGTAFASTAALGILAGTASVAVFCLAYGWLIFHLDEPMAIVLSWVVFLSATWLLEHPALSPIPAYVGVIALLLLVQRTLPGRGLARRVARLPWWDIPARMTLATGFVLLLTSVAPALGPRLSGLLSPFPIFLATMGTFTHTFEGAPAAAGLLHGAVAGLYSFATFFLVVTVLLATAGLAVTFVAATAVTLAMQAVALWLLGRADTHGRLSAG